jgi:hypothetical protein
MIGTSVGGCLAFSSRDEVSGLINRTFMLPFIFPCESPPGLSNRGSSRIQRQSSALSLAHGAQLYITIVEIGLNLLSLQTLAIYDGLLCRGLDFKVADILLFCIGRLRLWIDLEIVHNVGDALGAPRDFFRGPLVIFGRYVAG